MISLQKQKTTDFEITQSELKSRMDRYLHLELEQSEVVASAQIFFGKAMKYRKLLVHAAVVCLNNDAYMFFAPASGGKSTHIHLWKEVLGEKAQILADDSPIVGCCSTVPMVWNSPWSKNTEIITNRGFIVRGISFINKGINNNISKITRESAIDRITKMYPDNIERDKMKNVLEEFLQNVPIWNFEGDSTIEAAKVAIDSMCVIGDYYVI